MKKLNLFRRLDSFALSLLLCFATELGATNHIVEFSSNVFKPSALTVNVGDTVTFTNKGGFHTVTGTGTEAFCGNGAIPSSCSVTFKKPGTFPYRCVFHSTTVPTPAGMIGSITVQDVPTEKPNLVPFHLNGWSDRLVVSRTPGNNISDPDFFDDQDLWVDWAIANISLTTAIPNRFFTELQVDGVSRASWFHDGLPPDTFNKIEDYNLGKLPAGEHVLTLVTDHTSVVDESNETDNSYAVNVRVLKRPGVFHTVEYGTQGANVFTPSQLTINVGDTVVFLHATGFHTITGTGTEPFCGADAVPSTCSVTFNKPGTFPYRCIFHSSSGANPVGMVGSVTVVDGPSLESASQPEGPYVAVTNATFDGSSHKVTVALPPARAFWRLRGNVALKITQVQVVPPSVVLTYESPQ